MEPEPSRGASRRRRCLASSNTDLFVCFLLVCLMEVPLTTASTGALDSDVSSDYGEKKITTFQSICLLLNNVTGAAMVLYPGLLQQAGWLAPTVCMCVIASLTAVSGLCLVKTMQICPGNERYQQRYEFMNVAKQLFTPTQYKIVFCFFILSLFSSVIPLIIQSAQVMDFTLVALFSKTCGLQFSPSFQWICSSDSTNNVDPFGADVVILSVGVLVLAALCIPVGMWNLDDNMIIQTVATCFMLLIIGIWCGFFTTLGLNVDNMPMLGTDYSQVLGIVVFNYTFITCLPSWINEKAPEVNITRSIVYSLTGATAVFIVLGVMGALAYAPFFNTDADVLDKLNQSGNSLIRVTYFLFPIVVNLTSIPIFSIVIKYNLLSNHICSKCSSFFCHCFLVS
jgi:amino acid permease